MMKEIENSELKKRAFDVLCEVDYICRQNGFRYSLIFGTLLGAVRHSGFIPWDDDIDIAMPRPDYERFLEYCNKHNTYFKLISNSISDSYGRLFAKAFDPNTILEINDSSLTDNKVGVYIDIFPVDGFGDSMSTAQSVYDQTILYRELLNARCWRKFIRSKTHKWYYEPIRFCLFIISRFLTKKKLIKKIRNKLSKYKFEDSEYVSIICSAYRKKDIIERKVYENYVDILFEGKYFRCIKEYDYYLTQIYGQYMELPPEDKRYSHHIFKAYYC